MADPANTGTVYFAYDFPGVAASGTNQGIPLSAGDQAAEAPPAVFQGEVYAIATAAAQVLIVLETTVVEGPKEAPPT